MSRTLAAILGGAAGAVALVGILAITIWYCVCRGRNVSRTSETGSSDPSVQGNFHSHVHQCILPRTSLMNNFENVESCSWESCWD